MSESKPIGRTSRSQCQAEKAVGCHPTAAQFMVLGPAQWDRCKNKPVWIATERKPRKEDGRIGQMSLCECCKEMLIKQKGKRYAKFERIEK